MPTPFQVSINSGDDIVTARGRTRELARKLGFRSSDVTLIVTVVSELTRNIVQYAGAGEVVVNVLDKDRPGIEVTARDSGPGILDVRQAMQDGFSTSGGLGVGLPGVRRLVDEFEIDSNPGKGTTVIVRKWQERPITSSNGV